MQKILVVDDEPAIVTLLSYNLTQANYDVETAMNGNDALALATSQTFDAILLDLMLPGMDGVEVTRKLRQERIATPIIMITAKTDEFDKVFGLEIGADDYITKPLVPEKSLPDLRQRYGATRTSQKTSPQV